MMKMVILVLTVALLLAACCDNPAALKVAKGSIVAVQSFYDPLVGAYLDDQTNDTARLALVSADTALALAGIIQEGYCASQAEANQLQLQTESAKKLAAEAGVK